MSADAQLRMPLLNPASIGLQFTGQIFNQPVQFDLQLADLLVKLCFASFAFPVGLHPPIGKDIGKAEGPAISTGRSIRSRPYDWPVPPSSIPPDGGHRHLGFEIGVGR